MRMNNSPVIIGVGEDFELTPSDLSSARSSVALAADAGVAAIDDAGGARVRDAIDALVAVRTYPDSTPFWPHAVTLVKNTPRAIARRIGVSPARAFYESVGGQSPQKLVGEFAARLAKGEFKAVLIAGADAIATEKAAQRAGVTLDWAEEADGEIEDRALGVDGLLSAHEIANGLVEIGAIYALFENARRARLGLGRDAYAQAMGALFEPFAAIAAATKGAIDKRALSAGEIAAASVENPMLFDPYRKTMIAKDGVNQAAALLMTTAGQARALGVPEEKWIYLRGLCDTVEKPIMDRPELDRSPAMRAAYQTALKRAGVAADAVSCLDLYSCFPIAVFEAREAMAIATGDQRALTMIGGLPFFGGPGNNYSMHAISALVRRLRSDRHGFGVVGANGGFLTKHSVGVYSAKAPAAGWAPEEDAVLQADLDNAPNADWTANPEGAATIETYTITWRKSGPVRAHVIGVLSSTGGRFLASTAMGDQSTLGQMAADDPLGAKITVSAADQGSHFSL
jgi:acetyl-CoA C-acetyltransferase